jgi:hypothetical protein
VAINLADNQSMLLLKGLFMSRNMGIIIIVVRAASLVVIQEDTTEGRGFWEVSFLELLIVKSGVTESTNFLGVEVLAQ